VRYGTADGSKVKCEMFDQATGSMVLDGASPGTWVMPNANARGYYRFNMSKPQWHALTQHVTTLSDAEQLAYADGIDAGFRHGELDAGDALAALRPLASARTPEVLTAPLDTVDWIYRHEAQTEAERNKIADWVKSAYLPRLQELGYRRKPGEADGDTLLRMTLAHAMALDFDIPAVRTALLEQGDAALAKKADGHLDFAAADPDLLGDALSVAVQERGKPAVDALIGELPQVTDPATRNAILAGLSAANTPAVANVARDFALSKQVKVGEMAAVLRGGRDTAAARDALWQWFTGHYDQVIARTGSFASGYLPRLVGGGSCSVAEADRLQAYFEPRVKEITGADRGLAQTREQTLLCAALKAKQNPAAILR
jgi:alanyl aminopeptidase